MEGGIYEAPCTGISADVMCTYVHNALTMAKSTFNSCYGSPCSQCTCRPESIHDYAA